MIACGLVIPLCKISLICFNKVIYDIASNVKVTLIESLSILLSLWLKSWKWQYICCGTLLLVVSFTPLFFSLETEPTFHVRLEAGWETISAPRVNKAWSVTLLIELSPFFINLNISVYCGTNTCSQQAPYNIVLYHTCETPRDRKSLATRGIWLWSLSRSVRGLVERNAWANIPASLGVFDNF